MIVCIPCSNTTWIDLNRPNTAFAPDEGIEVRVLNIGSPPTKTQTSRGLLQATIPPEVVAASIISAYLCLYWASIDATISVIGNRLSQTGWTDACTWNKYDGVNAWTLAGGDYETGADNAFTLTIPSVATWTETDITAFIAHTMASHSNVPHILLRLTTEATTSTVGGTCGSEHPSIEAFYFAKPYIKIVCPPFGMPMEV